MPTIEMPNIEITFKTAGLVIHPDAGLLEAFAHDAITTDADWKRVISVVRGLGGSLTTDDYYEDPDHWMIMTGSY